MSKPPRKYSATVATERQSPLLVGDIMALRKRLFIDIAQWDLQPEGEIERDEFDHEFAFHVGLARNEVLVGTFRAIRTDRRYLAADVFPTLAKTVDYPSRPDAWEISRFGVLPLEGPRERFEAALLNYALMFRFAQERGARSLVAIADLGYERFLRTLGIKTRRYGPPQIIGATTDGQPLELVAGEIPITDQSGPKFELLMKKSQQIEVTDETAVFRPSRLSA